MTTPTHPSPSAPDVDRVPLRLDMNQTMGDGAVDGSWWPQSRDLSLELADLVDHLPVALGEIHRVVFSRPDWDTAPHQVRVARGPLKVGSYPRHDNHQVWLRTSTGNTMRLSVTAPEGSPRSGADSPPAPPSQPMDASDVDGDEGGADPRWKDDGGAWWYPHAVAPSQRI